ncbi:hypothetical protein VTP01DRAFT_8058 [Rhizomucor pusillus]|uniref:uncharacterized protein n=1 Tax=Rhizomucor pusillus TaxID=4840 RepID=UPI0037436AEE
MRCQSSDELDFGDQTSDYRPLFTAYINGCCISRGVRATLNEALTLHKNVVIDATDTSEPSRIKELWKGRFGSLCKTTIKDDGIMPGLQRHKQAHSQSIKSTKYRTNLKRRLKTASSFESSTDEYSEYAMEGSSKRRNVKTTEKFEDGAQEDNGVEIDDLFVENLQLSVGTVIKRGASKVFAKLQKEAIMKSERKLWIQFHRRLY